MMLACCDADRIGQTERQVSLSIPVRAPRQDGSIRLQRQAVGATGRDSHNPAQLGGRGTLTL